MHAIVTFLKKKQNLAVVVVGSILAGYISFLLGVNYLSQQERQELALEQLRYDTEKRATAVSYFYSARRGDLKDLAAGREVSIFFENKALGMSAVYGLRASLFPIEESFKYLLEERTLGEEAIYTRIAFIDSAGELLVDSQQAQAAEEQARDWKKFLSPKNSEAAIVVESDAIMISNPYFFKGSYAGQFVAWISSECVYKHLVKVGPGFTKRLVTIAYGTGKSFPGMETPAGFPFSETVIPVDVKSRQPYRFETVNQNGRREEMLAIRMPVKDTPFSIVTVLPVAEVFGRIAPWHLLVVMGILALALLGGMVLVLRTNMQNLVLNARLEEESKSKQQVEKMVEERTRELKEAQQELLNKAIESGRAQLSAMVLHNIGNAITPISVYVETMKAPEVEEIVRYIGKCYDDLTAHSGDLQQYVNADARGRQVFSWMGELIHAFLEQNQKQSHTVHKMDGALSYISEILTLQQTYAASERELKEQIDINSLIEDAIRMQTGALEKRGISVKKELEPNISKVLIDKSKLMQVIINFIKNSSEAIDELKNGNEEKMITFKSFIRDGHAGFEIDDNGIGIDPEQIGQIFEFGKSYKGSSGFGLYYCKMFVEANKGTLQIISPGKGKGTTVLVGFPVPGH